MEKLDFKVEGKIENLSKIADFIEQATQRLGLNKSKRFDVMVAVGEACENIIQHGYSEKKGYIEIKCEMKDGDFLVRIRDWGRAFDPKSVPCPNIDAPLEQRRGGGWGIYFMKSLMDEIDYHFDSKRGNELVMLKKGGEKMEIAIKDLEKASVISVSGRIDAATAPDLENRLNELIASGRIKVVINFNGVEYISSGGLRVLLATAKELQRKDGALRLCQLEQNVYKVFKLAGFTTIFNIYDTEDEALKDI
ncbi:MAG: anti-sigma factor antagonist [bacterium]